MAYNNIDFRIPPGGSLFVEYADDMNQGMKFFPLCDILFF